MAETTDDQHEQKPLSQKTPTELKREARARLRRLDPATAAALVDEAVAKKVTSSFSGFAAFIRERAIVGLAVGFVIGAQVQSVVKQFIASFVDPLFKLLVPGNTTLSQSVWKAPHGASFGWGAFVYQLLDLLFVLSTIYAVIKLFRLDRLEKKN